MTAGTFASVGSLAVTSIVVREVAQRPHAVGRTLSAAFLLVCASTIGVTVLGLVLIRFAGFSSLWASWGDAPWALLLGSITLIACAQAISAVSMSALTGGQAFKSWTAISLGKALLIGTVTVSFATTQSVPIIFGMITIAEIVGCFAAIGLARRLGSSESVKGRSRNVRRIFSDVKDLLRESIGPGIAGQSIAVASWFALTLLLDVAGTEVLGSFIIAVRIVFGASFIPMSVVDANLGQLHLNAIQVQEPKQVKPLLTRSFFVAVATTLVLIVSAPTISLIGTDYGPAITTIRILALSLPFITLNAVLGNVALSRRRMRLWAFSDVILAATWLLGGIALIQSFGADGLAASIGIAHLVSVIVLLLPLQVLRSNPRKNSQ